MSVNLQDIEGLESFRETKKGSGLLDRVVINRVQRYLDKTASPEKLLSRAKAEFSNEVGRAVSEFVQSENLSLPNNFDTLGVKNETQTCLQQIDRDLKTLTKDNSAKSGDAINALVNAALKTKNDPKEWSASPLVFVDSTTPDGRLIINIQAAVEIARITHDANVFRHEEAWQKLRIHEQTAYTQGVVANLYAAMFKRMAGLGEINALTSDKNVAESLAKGTSSPSVVRTAEKQLSKDGSKDRIITPELGFSALRSASPV